MLETMGYKVCQSCADIVTQGYTHHIDDWREHRNAVDKVDSNLFQVGEYWLETTKTLYDDFSACEFCGVVGCASIVYSACNSED